MRPRTMIDVPKGWRASGPLLRHHERDNYVVIARHRTKAFLVDSEGPFATEFPSVAACMAYAFANGWHQTDTLFVPATIKAVSVRQPWCWAIMHAGKNIENRSWKPWGDYRGPLAILASKSVTEDEYEVFLDILFELEIKTPVVPEREKLELGGLVGVVDLVGCREPVPLERATGWQAAGQFGWELERPVPLPLRPYTGFTGMRDFELTPTEHQAILTAWSAVGTDTAWRKSP